MKRERLERAESILAFWFGDLTATVIPGRLAFWFQPSEQTDRSIRERFEADVAAAAAGRYGSWLEEPRGRLALIILLDQFSRNLYRGRAEAFAQDGLAQKICLEGISRGAEELLHPVERCFFYMPLEHAEDLALQRQAVEKFHALLADVPAELKPVAAGFYEYAVRHERVIERFGRFPHRNAILGRPSSREEAEYLSQGVAF